VEKKIIAATISRVNSWDDVLSEFWALDGEKESAALDTLVFSRFIISRTTNRHIIPVRRQLNFQPIARPRC
jgi:hypothetical protein